MVLRRLGRSRCTGELPGGGSEHARAAALREQVELLGLAHEVAVDVLGPTAAVVTARAEGGSEGAGLVEGEGCGVHVFHDASLNHSAQRDFTYQ